jgi:D-arginine dehydrogenase
VDVLVIGGGIAGVAAGYYLAKAGCRVTLLEKEAVLAYHSTGRSAALYFEEYGVPAIRPLTRASRGFFDHPPSGLTEARFLTPRGALWVGRSDQMTSLQGELAASGPSARWLEPAQAVEIVPVLRPDYLAGAVWAPEALDLDVASIHQAFVRGMRRLGATIRTGAPVERLRPAGGGWEAEAGGDRLGGDVIVNAAGAWADEVARLAGIPPVGIRPLRRTAFMVPGDPSYAGWPLVADANNEFYFRPDGSQILCSLADETWQEPGDARPQDLDIALAIERINTATTLAIRTVRSSWAGLRSFVADRAMVIGFDPAAAGFFWLAAQGGTGIQTAPGAGELTASLVTSGAVPDRLAALGIDLAALSPARFRAGG